MHKGAGILVVELYLGAPVVTLFGMNAMNYSDPGGRSNIGEKPEETAYREGREETENLINIKPHELLQYAMPIQINQYIAYIIYVENLSFQDYAHNVNLIYNNCQPRSWKETNSMARIPLNNIMMAAQGLANFAVDVNGSTVNIRARTMDIIRAASNIFLGLPNVRPIPLYRHLVTTSRLPCLIGTYTYTLSPQAYYTPPPLPASGPYSNIEYAVYIAPNLTEASNKFLYDCDKKWGGMHVTIAGYHTNQPAPKKFLKNISKSGKNMWTITDNTIKVKDNTIYFKSKTLDSVANFLHKNGFNKVKGPIYAKTKWHITSECTIPKNIKAILKNLTWSLVLVSRENNKIKWLKRYPLHIL